MRVSLFVLVALSIYAAMHLLVYWGVRPLLPRHPAATASAVLWAALMIVAPVLVRWLAGAEQEAAARGLAWVGYSWAGFLFLAFWLSAALGVWELAAWLLGKGLPALPPVSLRGPLSAAVLVAVTVGAGLYGFYEAAHLRVETVPIATAKLGPGTDRLRIAQVSDLHLGLLHREGALAPVVSRLKELRPDLLVATGDVVDAQINHLDGLSSLWQEIDPPLGKFAVVGNHEIYAGLGESLDFLRRSGFTVLRGEGRTVGGALTLVGVDDDHVRDRVRDEAALRGARNEGLFTVLLKHRPAVGEGAAGLFDLQISGHTHRGQIFPFRFLTALAYPMQDGLYDLPGGAKVYSSRGTGTWGPPIRVLSPPEITLFEITRDAAAR